MSKHLSLRSGNPALSSNTFNKIQPISIGEKMTISGTVNKTLFSLIILLLTGYFAFTFNGGWLFIIGGSLSGFVLALITIFKKSLSPITVPLYAGVEGLAMGAISAQYTALYDGIVPQAITLTLGILFALLFAYKTKIIAATENFKLGVFAATGGIFIVYFISFIMSFIPGLGFPEFLNPTNGSWLSIGFSLFVVIIASLNLVLDFDYIEEGAEIGLPKYMEWYGAFGLLVTLIWLYLEILRLLSKLRSR